MRASEVRQLEARVLLGDAAQLLLFRKGIGPQMDPATGL
jgi:hypothetical protein